MTSPQTPSESRVDFSCPEPGVVIVRVIGRGSFQISACLKAIPELAEEAYPDNGDRNRYIVDLEKCVTMDSTFFGVLAGIGLAQKRRGQGQMVLVNANSHICKILDTLGLSKFMSLRRPEELESEVSENVGVEALKSDEEFTKATVDEPDKIERIVMMLEAHEQLIDVYDSNKARFKSVVECLKASLDAEEAQDAATEPDENSA